MNISLTTAIAPEAAMVAVTERMAADAVRKAAAEVTAAAVITMKDMKAAAMGKATGPARAAAITEIKRQCTPPLSY